jgi:preprotein translocase subunit SecF
VNFNIPFMSYRRVATISSLVLLVLSVGSLSFKGLNLGLDFSGGTLIEVSYEQAADLADIRDLVFTNGFDDFQVVNFGSNSDVLIKVADKNGNSQIGDVVFKFLQAADPAIELKRIEFVGPSNWD